MVNIDVVHGIIIRANQVVAPKVTLGVMIALLIRDLLVETTAHYVIVS